ncbi:phosphoesterase [Pyrococcus furiosus DSM 3638]|uniref:RCK N-terminal domain-containing protein n=3 Tax=Pyrococcus furiosus TaxID=2261 RepID=Q8TZP5_PYRFU|nr:MULTISPECIES: DHH family phosphoesterase [Pyrococcus]AAL82066.1 hypothetical protein PF1942 [Pyrococcus furiosus DSM 3638]AFN04697.1 hypothetical protein PFC_08870 [Pyrococcus furiosus COM1]MDK2869393.1 hypothetical protein [Pyrococcus sp.]QEK79537.1 phosphoesterase [Pyrococcus furiosus DSM 3638]
MRVLVLGGGVLGRAIAESLFGEFEVIVVEKDEVRVQTLAEKGLQVVQGDFSYTATLLKAHIEKADLIVITISDPEVIAKTLHVIQNNNKDAAVLLILPEDTSLEEIASIAKEKYDTDVKVDYVINPRSAIVRAVVDTIEKIGEKKNSMKLIEKLNEIKENTDTLLIVMHDNPDPDCMASASALSLIAQTVGLKTVIVYGGDITHHQNRAMVNILGMDFRKVSRGSYEIKRHSAIAIVDAQPNGNISILDDEDIAKVQIIIDHHQILQNLREKLPDNCFVDIRPEANSTSSILVEYLKSLEIPIDENLATALFYGMYIDTKKFSKLSKIDIKAIEFLSGHVDYDLLDKIEFPDISTETAEILARAILNRRIYKNVIISNVGFIANRDAIAEAADFLLRLEGITTVLVFGIVDDRIEISARTRDVRVNIGAIMKEAFGSLGSGGGHPQAGGARIPLGIFKLAKDKASLLRLVEEAITERFLEALGMREGT